MKAKNAPPNVAASSGAGGTNLTTRYCVRAYYSTEERKRQDAKATTINATAK